MNDYSKVGLTPEEINGESPLWCFLWLVVVGVVAGLASLGFCSGLFIGFFLATKEENSSSKWEQRGHDDEPWIDLDGAFSLVGLLISAFVITFCLDWLLFRFGFWASAGSGVLSAVLFPVGFWLFEKMKPNIGPDW